MQREIIVPETEEIWLAERAKDLTSTECAALFNAHEYLTPLALWLRKSGKIPDDFKGNEFTKWGNRLEPVIAAGMAEDNGWSMRPMKEYIRLAGMRVGSSFDYRIRSSRHDDSDSDMLLEIKNVGMNAFRSGWSMNDDDEIEAPMRIEFQVQHEMLVAGLGGAKIGAFVGGNTPHILHREADKEIHALILEKAEAFWRSVAKGVEPSPDPLLDHELVKRLHRHAEPGKVMLGGEELQAMLDAYKAAGEEKSLAEDKQTAMKTLILDKFGDAEIAVGTGLQVTMRDIAEIPPTVITAEMVGTSYGGRKGYRGWSISKVKTPKQPKE